MRPPEQKMGGDAAEMETFIIEKKMKIESPPLGGIQTQTLNILSPNLNTATA